MRHSQVRNSLYWLSGSILLVSLLAFCVDGLFWLFGLVGHGQSHVMAWGFIAAGTIGCFSILMLLLGIVQSPERVQHIRMYPAVTLFLLAMLLFSLLLYRSLHEDPHPRLRPGETLTI